MRLIDADAYEEKLKAYLGGQAIGFLLVGTVRNEPTIDAIPVVRCKDCKHKGWVQEPCHGKSVDFCHVWDTCINNAGKCFCSYGERKDGDS